MSERRTRDTLLSQLIANFTDVEILYENRNEIPKGDEFLECFFIPVTNDSLGKDNQNTQDEGIFQVTVATKKGAYDTRQLELVDRVYQAFGINTTISYNAVDVNFSSDFVNDVYTVFNYPSTDVYITEYSTNAGRESDGFYKRDVSIGYLTFS